MTRLFSPAVLLPIVLSAAVLHAQTSIGTIEAASATISGTLSLTGGKAVIGGNAVITARDRTATLQLSRGGEVLVCSTSALHAARGSGPNRPEPLLLALDRGAIEIHMGATDSDTILTPDLRFTITSSTGLPAAGLLDLRIRVAASGDTCVDNRGQTAPTLNVSEQFGTALYQVRPNQHLLFEHGSLREVVDDERSPCGCPPPPVLSTSNSGLSTDVTRAARPGARVADDPDEVRPHTPAEAQHPFPTAESQGLTPSDPAAHVPQATPGQPHAQVAATLAYSVGGVNADGTGESPAPSAAEPTSPLGSTAPATPAPAPPATLPASRPSAPGTTTTSPTQDKLADHEVAQSPLPPPAPPPRTLAHRVGHFFRRLFGGR